MKAGANMFRCSWLALALGFSACAPSRVASTRHAREERAMVTSAFRRLPGSYTTGPNMVGTTLHLARDGGYRVIDWGCIRSEMVEYGLWHPDPLGIEMEPVWKQQANHVFPAGFDASDSKRGLVLVPRPSKTTTASGWAKKIFQKWKNQ